MAPGIILSFNSIHGPLSYPCDRYSEWTDNLRAIALALKALRAVDRYGVTRRAEQYKGWSQLPPPAEGEMSEAAARSCLVGLIGAPAPGESLKEWIRRAELQTHPDRGGQADDFNRVQRARAVLLREAA